DRALLLFKGQAVAEGATADVLEQYHRTVSEKLAAAVAAGDRGGVVASSHAAEPRLRLLRVEMLNEDGEPSTTFASGSAVTFRVPHAYAVEALGGDGSARAATAPAATFLK